MKKFALLYLPVAAVMIFVIVGVGLLLVRSDLDEMRHFQKAAAGTAQNVATSALLVPTGNLEGMIRELQIRDAVSLPPGEAEKAVESYLRVLLYRNPVYDRARWISKDGRELVCVQQGGDDELVTVPHGRMEDLSGRAWFHSLSALPPGGVYMSMFDLNRAGDKPESPLKPVIRFGAHMPTDEGHDPGFIVVSLNAGDLLERLRHLDANDMTGSVELINPQGQWLLAAESGDAFGFAMGDPGRSFAARNPAEWAFISASPEGQKMTDTGLWTWATIDPASILGGRVVAEESWKLVTHVPSANVSHVAWANWRPLLIIGVAALGIMAFGVWKYRQVWERREMAAAEAALAQDKQSMERKLRMATGGGGVGVWSWDVSSGRMDWSDVCKAHLALPPGGKPSMEHFYAVMHPADRAQVKQILEESVAQRQEASLESRIIHRDGSVHWITARWRVYDNPDGSLAEIGGITVDNTARRQAEEDLRELNLTLEHRIEERTADLFEARERLSKTIENAPAGVCLVAPDGRFLEVNPALCTILGRDAEAIMASTWQDLTHPDDIDSDASLVGRVMSGEIQTYQLQKRYLRPDGEVVWCLLAVSCQRNPDGSVKNFISQVSDINEEVQARLRLADSQNRFRLLAENASDVVVQTDGEGVIQWISPSVTAALGHTVAGVTGTQLRNLIHPEDWEAYEALEEQLRQGMHAHAELRMQAGDSGHQWFSLSMRPQAGGGGGGIGGFHDIHREVQARELVKTERQHLRATLDSLLDPHILAQPVRDRDGSVMDIVCADANPAACAWLGIKRERLLGCKMLEVFPRIGTSGLMEIFRETVETGRRAILDDFEILRDDAKIWLDLRGVRVGKRVSVVWRDVTERHLASERIAASEERYRLLAKNALDVVLRLDGDGNILWVSPSLTGALGWDPEEWEGRHVVDVLADDAGRSQFHQDKLEMEGGTTVVSRVRIRSKDGAPHWVEVHAGPYRDEKGMITGNIGSFRVVDKEIAAEQLLERQAKTDALTGISNRREFDATAHREIARARRQGDAVSLMLMDIDLFKSINDAHGHMAGDRILKIVAGACASHLREIDLLARYGGDEFAILLPGTDLNGAKVVAERIREALEQLVIAVEGGRLLPLTVSLGVVELGDMSEGLDELIKRADDALYHAKQTGRNRTCRG